MLLLVVKIAFVALTAPPNHPAPATPSPPALINAPVVVDVDAVVELTPKVPSKRTPLVAYSNLAI